jgi:hypothetical protein
VIKRAKWIHIPVTRWLVGRCTSIEGESTVCQTLSQDEVFWHIQGQARQNAHARPLNAIEPCLCNMYEAADPHKDAPPPPPPPPHTTHYFDRCDVANEGAADTALCTALMSSPMPCPSLACPLPLAPCLSEPPAFVLCMYSCSLTHLVQLFQQGTPQQVHAQSKQ